MIYPGLHGPLYLLPEYQLFSANTNILMFYGLIVSFI